MVFNSSSKIENFENFRTSKNVFYIFYGLLHFQNDFYIFKRSFTFFGKSEPELWPVATVALDNKA